jgi:hypothetical protein
MKTSSNRATFCTHRKPDLTSKNAGRVNFCIDGSPADRPRQANGPSHTVSWPLFWRGESPHKSASFNDFPRECTEHSGPRTGKWEGSDSSRLVRRSHGIRILEVNRQESGQSFDMIKARPAIKFEDFLNGCTQFTLRIDIRERRCHSHKCIADGGQLSRRVVAAGLVPVERYSRSPD